MMCSSMVTLLVLALLLGSCCGTKLMLSKGHTTALSITSSEDRTTTLLDAPSKRLVVQGVDIAELAAEIETLKATVERLSARYTIYFYSNDTLTINSSYTQAIFELYGAGGLAARGGGGGGAYCKASIAVTPNQTFNITVGSGNSTNAGDTTVSSGALFLVAGGGKSPDTVSQGLFSGTGGIASGACDVRLNGRPGEAFNRIEFGGTLYDQAGNGGMAAGPFGGSGGLGDINDSGSCTSGSVPGGGAGGNYAGDGRCAGGNGMVVVTLY
eukprot:TRINITY_DN496_c0_g2_i1.p1 TRINITY_DN496_c0_g2~~TRINITY_DN496_c0_g2_i1.p1  ORF type:complete len:269 (+),score=32.93 TRINITY_DN496_c0_g2_i1:106-912(+)